MQGSLANFLSPMRDGLACSRLASRRRERGVRSDSKEVWEHHPKSECPTRATMVTEVRPKRRYARMKVLIGVDPHKASLAVAAVDEDLGELLERAAFPQNRDGLRSLERWARRFPERRWAVENAGGLGRHLAVRLVATGESVVDVPPKLSARVRVLSSFAGNARKNDGVDALATALAASRNDRLAAVDPEAASEALRLLSERRLLTWWPSAPGRSTASTRSCGNSSPEGWPGGVARRGGPDALGRSGRAHLARHTSPGRRLGPPAPALGV
jgi:Transposase